MKKVLFLSNTANFSKFNLPYMHWFREHGWQVDYCSPGEEPVEDCDRQFTICIDRSPLAVAKNIAALKQLRNILEDGRYDILHFMPGFQEGLPVSIIEAVAEGLPVVASKIRGHVDVIEDKINVFLCDIHDAERFIDCVVLLYKNPALRSEIASRNAARAQLFSVKKAVSAMGNIYRQLIQPEQSS